MQSAKKKTGHVESDWLVLSSVPVSLRNHKSQRAMGIGAFRRDRGIRGHARGGVRGIAVSPHPALITYSFCTVALHWRV